MWDGGGLTGADMWDYPGQALFLMPISFLLLISGVFAIFSTSTNLVVQGQLRLNNREPFDMFALAPAVTACTAASLVYLIVVPPFVLRQRDHPDPRKP